MKIRLPILLFFLFYSSITFAAEDFFYTRCERGQPWTYTSNMSVGGVVQDVTKTFNHMDAYDTLLDVTGFLSDKYGETDVTGPCDLMYDDGAGNRQVVYECSALPDSDSCVAVSDGEVTFDGNEFLFTVMKGQLHNKSIKLSQLDMHPDADNPYQNARPDNYGWIDIPNKTLLAKGATVYKANKTTWQITELLPYEEGIWKVNPVPVSQDRFWYVSNETRNDAALVFGNVGTVKSTVAHTANILDGKDIVQVNRAPMARDMHGTFMINPTTSEGWMVYTRHMMMGGYPFRHDNGTPGSDGTLDNFTSLWMCGLYCENDFASLGQHSVSGGTIFGTWDTLKALRFPTQMTSYDIALGDYYRRNNNALGIVLRYTPLPHGIEGPNSQQVTNVAEDFLPPTLHNITTFTNSDDATAPPIANWPYVLAGKVGQPEALPNDKLMMVYGIGGCSSVLVNDAFTFLGETWPIQLSSEAGYWGRQSNFYDALSQIAGVTIPGCKVGIYKAETFPVTHPDQLIEVVNTDEWHEILPKLARPLSELYTITPTESVRPDLLANNSELPRGTSWSMVGGTITPRETEPCYGHNVENSHNFNGCGTDMFPYQESEIAGILFLAANPNPEIASQTSIANTWGFGTRILGYVPIESDGSFAAYVPGGEPVTFGLADADGNLLNIDMTFDANLPGEEKTCVGCHFHSDNSTLDWNTTIAGQNRANISKLGNGTVPTFKGRDQSNNVVIENIAGNSITVDYDDVQAVFNQFCTSCHGVSNPAGGLDLSTPPTGNPFEGDSTWKTLAWNNVGPNHSLRRPYQSPYIKAFNPRGSLLYWKAVNERKDNRLDTDLPNDIDFGADHPTSITPEGARTIARWIMLGTPANGIENFDRLSPTVNLRANIVNDEVTGFVIGTYDGLSGLDENTLLVCIVTQLGCNNISPSAINGGIVTANLSTPIPNTEWDKEVKVSVTDLAGNVREIQHTLNYLAKFEGSQTPPPPPPPTDPLTLDVGADFSVNEMENFQLTLTVSGGVGDRTYSVDWGNGETENGTILESETSKVLQKQFADGPNSFTLTASVTDSESNNITDTATITVNDIGATGTVGGNTSVDVGVTYQLNLTYSDPADPLTHYIIEWETGVTENVTINSPTHVYDTTGQKAISVTAVNKDGSFPIGTVNLTVNEVIIPNCVIEVTGFNEVNLTNCNVIN